MNLTKATETCHSSGASNLTSWCLVLGIWCFRRSRPLPGAWGLDLVLPAVITFVDNPSKPEVSHPELIASKTHSRNLRRSARFVARQRPHDVSLTERSLDRAMKGLFDRNDNLCANAIADDEEIDQLEKQIDKDGVDVLLRFQPVASDLRRVVSAP